jgi:glycosyltransferase involved in cell wall biosynthesis
VWLGGALGVPVILHLAGADIDTQFEHCPRFVKVLLRRTLNRARFVIVLGRYWRDLLVDRVGVSPDRVVVIPNGVPEPQPAERHGRDGPCRILSLGRLGARKGTATALEALADPRLCALDWTATFAGDGEVEAMRRLADRLGLHDRCSFPGWLERDDVSRLLREADIFVLPSRQEGLPVAILEAMAHSLAIVSTRAGSIEDAITDGKNGLLVPTDDRRAVSEALLHCLSCPDLRRRLQQAARERYQRDYTATLFAERVLSLYRRCDSAD